MSNIGIGILVLVVVLLLFVGGGYGWYHNPSAWEEHTFHGVGSASPSEAGDPVVFHSGPKLPQYLRFKDSVLTLTDKNTGETQTHNVTSVLNGMAVGLKGTQIAATPLGLNMRLDPSGKKPGEAADVVFDPLDAVTFNIDFGDNPPPNPDAYQNNDAGLNAAIREWRNNMNDRWVAKLTTKVRVI